ncbi:RTA1 like protein [Aspergillus granulosus]|uniref:RTA1 like protein n=1 Tax=Aspergillus granulosus TaxID=176169 RepID=A0ABR4HU61_9EURO
MSSTYVLYHYSPSFPAAVCFAIGFGASAAIHIWQTCRYKTKFMAAFIIGAILESLGYIARMISAKQTPNWSVGPYALQSLLLLLAPPLLAASIYTFLSRIICLVEGESRSPIQPQKMTKIFVTGDVISFLLQSGGGAILAQAKTASKVHLGERIIIVGLFVQVIFFGVFMIVSVLFHKNIHSDPTPKSLYRPVSKSGGMPLWKSCLFLLYATSMLIMVRSIYRVIEYIQGSQGFLQSHEVFLYVFDAALILIVCGIFNARHPGILLDEDLEDGGLEMGMGQGEYSRVT